jgi:hypothetical protein
MSGGRGKKPNVKRRGKREAQRRICSIIKNASNVGTAGALVRFSSEPYTMGSSYDGDFRL